MPISARPWLREPARAESIDACSSRLIERAALRIQNTIEVSTATASEPDEASNSSWVALRKLGADKLEPSTDEQGCSHREQHADPDRRDPGAASGLRQIASDDAHDQGGLDALPQHHKKWDQHQRTPDKGNPARSLSQAGRTYTALSALKIRPPID